jgi:hypothetical protein
MKLIEKVKQCKTKIQEENEMKTQVFKNSETVKSSNSMMVFTMIIFGSLFLFAADNMHLLSKSGTFNSLSKQDNELQFQKMNQSENAAGNETATSKNPGSEIEFSMAKMQEYLIPENEPELTVADANSIVFPDAETIVLTANKALSNDYFLKDLKIQASEKTKEAVEYYALEKKVKEFLTIEIEKPLKLEEWMVSGKCWCSEPEEKLAFSEGN